MAKQMDYEKKILELERRIKELEARPIYIPVYYPQPVNPVFPAYPVNPIYPTVICGGATSAY